MVPLYCATIISAACLSANTDLILLLAWVHTLDEDDESLVAAARSLLDAPANVRIAQHNSTTETSQKRRSDPSRGRLYDHDREWTPPLPKESVTQSGSRWRTFVNASAYPATSAEGGKIVTQDWLLENGADYSRPWLAGATDGDPEKNLAVLYRFKARRRAWYIRAQRTVLRNSMVPLIIRMNVWFFSAVALGLASSIHHMAGNSSTGGQTPSTNMAIIVDAVALVYLVYITYDEYSGKPLGLRPAIAKMRLIFLDLFFIVFDSANLSLAFAAAGPQNCKNGSCGREKALASVLLFALIAWLLTFSISVMRWVTSGSLFHMRLLQSNN